MKHEHQTTFERTIEKLMKGKPKAKPLGRMLDGRWYIGTKSQHKTKQGRALQLLWRIKYRHKDRALQLLWRTKYRRAVDGNEKGLTNES